MKNRASTASITLRSSSFFWLGVALLVFSASGSSWANHTPFQVHDYSSAGVTADSALAVFLLGLAVGVLAGIGLFFFYLVVREKQETEHDREVDQLLESLSESDYRPNPWSPTGKDSSPRTMDTETAEEPRDPWEKPADWWRGSGDDA